jgi:signal peptidase I
MNNDERIIDIKSEETIEEKSKDRKKTSKGKNSFHLSVYDLVSIVMSAFIIIAVVFTFVFRLVGVSGYSMTNTLQHNDWLLTVNKESYERGDIVVITEPNYFDEPLIKRVIAKGGETVNIDFTTGTVYVDGVALKEPYTREDYILPKLDDIEFPYTVPEGHIFCMGDNRNGSTDSRSNLIGPLDERYVLGKAVIRILPFGDFDIYDYE